MASSRISAAGVVLCILTWISSYSAGVIAQPFVYVSNSSDGTISKIDAACNLVVETMHFPMPGYQPMGIAVKPNGTQIYVTYSASVPGIIGSFVAVIDTNASSCSNQDNSPTNLVRIVDIVPIPSTSLSIAVNPQGTRLYISDGTLGTISVIHLDSIDYILNATINVCAQQPCGIANGLAISPDGKHLFVAVTSSGAPSGYISVINIEGDSNIILQPPLPIASNDSMRPDPQGIAVSPDGNRVYVSVRFPSGGPGRLDIFKKAGNTNSYAPETCPPTCSVSIPSLIGLGIVVNPAGTRVYVPGRSFINTRLTEIIFEPPLADPIRTFRLKGSSLHSIAMHPGGSYVYVPDAAGSSAQVINVIDESALGIEVPGLEIDVGNGPFAISEFTNYNGTGSVDGTSQNAWLLLGNGGTNPSVNFLGTTDPTALEIRVNGKRALRLEPASIPNIIGGDSGNLITTGTIGATIAGGGGGGMPNQVSGNFATIGGGQGNTVSSSYGTVGGGVVNNALSDKSTVGGGEGNNAGVRDNPSRGVGSTVAGGEFNGASGQDSSVPGGEYNEASGKYSFAAGRRAKTHVPTGPTPMDHDGTFVWADSNNFDFYSTASNQFAVRAIGGFYFVSAIDGVGKPAAGVQLAPGGGSWSNLSDRNAKANFTVVNGRDILATLAQVPITEWNYTSQANSIRHIGPMAQDFNAAFQLGEDDTHITTVDAEGIALVSIQALYEMSLEKDRKIDQLEQRIEKLERLVQELTKK